ncbi:hypothetical protein [Methanobacterium bryantii]|uniref:hypothetical protein n=1 Tax=Methanobacterium bryantii TaxID=2161 RepID=UPI0015C7DA26|nr:hypothetical protein [Methanobacterium bryantii]
MLLTCDHLLTWHKGSEKIKYKTTIGVLGNRLNDSIYVDLILEKMITMVQITVHIEQ